MLAIDGESRGPSALTRLALLSACWLAGTGTAGAALPQGDAPAVPGERIVRFAEAPPRLLRDLASAGAEPVAVGLLTNVFLLRADRSQSILLRRHKELIRYEHPNYYLSLFSAQTPSDTGFRQQWALHPVDEELEGEAATRFRPSPGVHINALPAWRLHRGRTFAVAILDTGLAPGIDELEPNLWRGPDGALGRDLIKNAPVSFDSSFFGHGTRIASIIGAAANDDGPMVGVNWSCRMMPLRIFGKAPRGPVQSATTQHILDALSIVAKEQVRLSNNSYGAPDIGDAQALRDAIENLGRQGHLFVCAAGNDGENLDEERIFPASFGLENMLVVTSVGPDGRIPSSRARGRNSVHLAAPGEHVFARAKLGYSVDSGSSYATAHVTGAAALAWDCRDRLHPEDPWTHLQLKQAILDTVRVIAARPGEAGMDQQVISGGMLDLGRLLEAAAR